ncbi:MAG: hypothetical protein AB1705_07590 [Verrucomicrobiota bacterium]
MKSLLPILALVALLLAGGEARATFVSFEEAEGYDSQDNKTVVGLPNPGDDEEWNGPWEKSSGNDNRAVSSTDVAFHGVRSLRLGQSQQIEIARDVDRSINGGNPFHRIDVYAYVTQQAIDNQVQATFFVSTASNKFDESAAFRTQFSSTDNRMNWFVWDNGVYVDTGVAVVADTWTHLLVEMNMIDKTYVPQIDGTYVLPTTTLEFGPGSGGNSASSNITTGIGFEHDNNNGYVYFDAVGLRPNIPEPPVYFSLAGLIGAGLIPIWLRRRKERAAVQDS